jgi:hypothetical protein
VMGRQASAAGRTSSASREPRGLGEQNGTEFFLCVCVHLITLVGNYIRTARLVSYLVVPDQQKRCSKTPPPFVLQLHGVGSFIEFWSWEY